MGKPWEKYAPAQTSAPTPAPQSKVVAGPWAKYATSPEQRRASLVPDKSSYDEMAAAPQRSVVGSAPQWSTEAPTMGGRSIQDEGREVFSSAGTKLRLKTPGVDNRHMSETPDIVGGIGDLLKSANFGVRDWWKNSSAKDKENLIASIPIEATGAGAIARLSDHVGRKNGNDFLVDKTGHFQTDDSYDPVAELEMYLLNAGSWSTRNQVGGVVNPRGVTKSTIGPQLPGIKQALAKPTLKEIAPAAADVATNVTMGGSDLAAAGVRGGVELAKGVRNAFAGNPAPATANALVTPPAGPTPSPAPVAQPAVTQAPPVAAQAPPAGAGQQAAAGVTPPPAAAQPVLNATQVPPPAATAPAGGYTVSMAKSDSKIIGRILRDAAIPANDVKPLLADTIRAYQSFVAQAAQRGEKVRLPLSFFAEDYLATRLPPELAQNVRVKLQAFGNVANNSGDLAKTPVQRTAQELRGSQEEYLTDIFERELGDKSLVTTQGDIRGAKRLNADAVYKTELVKGQELIKLGKAKKEQSEGFDKLLGRMRQKEFFDKIPYELKVKAGNDIDAADLSEYITDHPLEAAHWLQSELGVLSRKGGDNAGAYHQMRMALLRPLEDAVPGYRGARKRAGDLVGQEIAVNFGDDLFRAGRTELQTAEMANDYKRLSPAQKEVAERSLRDKLKNEFRASREDSIDPTTGTRIDHRGAKLTELQKAGTLDAIEQILGAKGKRIADGIRNIMRENPRIPSYGSDSAKNLAERQAINEAVKSPLNRAVEKAGDKTSFLWTIPADIGAAAIGAPPLFTATKAIGMGIERFGKPSQKQLASAAKTLYQLPPAPANALAPSAPRTGRNPPAPRTGPRPLVTEADIQAMRTQYDALDHGKAPKTSEQLARRIVNAEKRLAAQQLPASPKSKKVTTKANALASPPSRPPVRNGPQSNAVPEIAAGVGGGAYGYANPQDMDGDGDIDETDRQRTAASYGVGSAFSVGIGRQALKAAGKGANAARNVIDPPLDLPSTNRIFAPGKPDDLGFITAAERAIAEPPARFRDAQRLTPEQWRKYMREAGASNDAFTYQIEPALKSLADQGYTGDIPKQVMEEALARNRGTLDVVDKKQLGQMGFEAQRTRERNNAEKLGKAIGQNRTREVERLRAKQREIEAAPVETKYDEYVAPGKSSNYQQHVLTLPPELGQGYKSHNWNTKNPVGHIRTTNRTSANGEKVLHVEELQSDLHQEGAKYGYKDEPRSKNLIAANSDYREKQSKWYRWYDENRDRPDVPDIVGLELSDLSRIKDPVGKEIFREAAAALDRVTELSRGGSPVPRAPLQNWEEPFIRYALRQGAEQGVDVVTFPKWDTMHEALKNEGTKKFYDGRLQTQLANVAKSLGLKVDDLKLDFGKQPERRIIAGIDLDGKRASQVVAKNKRGEWEPEIMVPTQAEAEKWIASKATNSVPAIRLTPEAKARLQQGVIMDAKDPRPAPKPMPKAPPVQVAFGGGPPKPPTNALAGKKPPPPPVSKAEKEARDALRKARTAHTNARRQNVMRDNRDELNRPLELAEIEAGERLQRVLNNDARARTLKARGKAVIDSPNVREPVGLAVAGTALIGTGLLGYNALVPKERGEKPMSPKDPRWFWNSIVNDKQTMVNVQKALRDWDEWPQEETKFPNGATTYKDVEMTGRFGKATKDALRSWKYARGLDPDAPLNKQELARLLAGPTGYQEKDGSWRYGADGERASIP